ncbi:tetratricopeptide repeat protein [Halomonas sp. 328]|uniref:tetratricopeptide repeat protein n=1 Tax=Halomonas sp. 328 TaxID=2776704 RepID=UPI0018A711B9|nr:tetratricopeptide repeat protein [Halomonas sp. 328]MBF8221171.1 tetratricopeptide repeat protein [Halomonas sp. 328]
MPPRLLPPLLLSALLAACQGSPIAPSGAPAEDPLASAPPVTRGLDAEGLATLLTAELAGQRGDYRRATEGYLSAAERYGDPALVERAALAARFSEDAALLEEAARRWQEQAPEAAGPQRLLASLALQRGDWEGALAARLVLSAQGGQGDLAGFAELAIEQGAYLPPLRERLRDFLGELPAGHPRHHDAVLATALLEAASGAPLAAEARLARLAESRPNDPALWLIRAQLALEAGDGAAARRAARRGLSLAPDDSRFTLALAQAELQLGNLAAAEAQTDSLLAYHDEHQELRLALARLYLEHDAPAPARRLLLPLIDAGDAPPVTYLLLGGIAAADGEVENALLYYRQVPPGDAFLAARLQAVLLLDEAGRFDEARELLAEERRRHPDQLSQLTSLEVELLDERGRAGEADALLNRTLAANPAAADLRYLRAMRAYQAGDVDAMEADLHELLRRDPESALALNALGYTYADENRRLDEALTLIERAHALEPDNAAILDSLGWVHYRLGDPDTALPYLERAYARMPDQEIAAHLIEVLWALGRHDEARARLREALERFEERPLIDDLLQRQPSLLNQDTP